MKPDDEWLKAIKSVLEYDCDSGLFTWKAKNKKVLGAPNSGVYITLSFQRIQYYAHRLAWLFVYDVWPTYTINHKNGEKRDNRISNLEDVEHHINLSLRHNVQGVRTRNGKFYARVCKHKKEFQKGPFKTKEEAHAAYFELRAVVLKGLY